MKRPTRPFPPSRLQHSFPSPRSHRRRTCSTSRLSRRTLDDELMRTVDEPFDDLPINWRLSLLNPIVEEDETVVDIPEAINSAGGSGWGPGRGRRISLNTMVVDIAFVIKRKLQRVRSATHI